MNKQIALIITTFKRNSLLETCIANNLKNLPDNSIILIGDQDFNNEKIEYYSKFDNVIYFPFMFDCGLCLDSETEILTKNGWKSYNTISYNDVVLSLNPTADFASYHKIDNIFVNPSYIGKILKYEGNTVNFSVTPNHQMYYNPVGKDWSKKNWQIKPLSEITQKWFRVKKNFRWQGKYATCFNIKGESLGKHLKIRKGLQFKMEDWLSFLGWYCSEGSTTKGSNGSHTISISQTMKKYHQDIDLLLTQMKIKHNYWGSDFRFGNKLIYNWLRGNCYTIHSKSKKRTNCSVYCCYNKSIPKFIFNLPPEQIKFFLNSFFKGDWTQHGKGRRYITSSVYLADGLQELILKTGGYATIRKVKPQTFEIKGRKICPQEFYYIIDEYCKNFETGLICQTKQKYPRNDSYIKTLDYSGLVWCVETNPHHLIYTRRNGKCCWTGNSSSRNRLVLEAKKLNIPYCLLMADSQWFNSKPDLSKIISFLESDLNNGIVGLKLNNLDGTNLSWEFDIELVPGKHFLMKLPKRPIVQFEGAKFQPCDVIKNFFLAKTQCLLDSPWSDELKLLEHEDFFYKLSQSKWKVFYNDSIIADRVKDRGIAYDKYRKRAYSEFAKKLRAKYHISGWIKKG
jgi:hypothetical protein